MYNLLKRLLDITVALGGLLLLLPLFVLLAIAIKLDSPGPVFYRGVRIGQHGRPFRIFKFRSMVANAERIGGASVPDTDPRITRIGLFLRKTKLDELPQLINVLKGEMSLVGPRPEVPQYVEMFTPEERAILSVKPGMTDWASLWDIDEGAILAGEPDPERAYQEKIRPEKIRLQLKYVRERSLWTDLKILALTLWSVASKPLKR